MKMIVVVSDMHIGNRYALINPKEVGEQSSAFNNWVFEKWTEFCAKYNNPDYLLLIGDLADGTGEIRLGAELFSSDLDKQTEWTTDLLKMIIGQKTQIFGCNGSGYHGGERHAVCTDRRIVENLGGKFKNYSIEVDIGSEKLQLSHGNGNSLVNPITYLQREIAFSKSDAQKRKVKGVTVIIRGHQHRAYSYQDDANIWGFLNGCWEYITPYMEKKTSNITPNIGAIILHIDETGKEPTSVQRIDFPIPEDVRTEMVGIEKVYEKEIKEIQEKRKLGRIKMGKEIFKKR